MPTFDVGLVMAGAVSAGAYTAGAVDFLLQALDDWQAAKDAGSPDAPPHAVRLSVLAGASAGGLTAGIVAAVLRERLPPVDDYPVQSRGADNKLFDAWVNRVDATGLLTARDLAADPGPVRSLLDSTVLDDIADRVFQPGPARPPRAYAADPLVVAVTLTNLRGVPYQIDFQGLAGARMPYVMTLHADQMTFAVGPPGPPAAFEAAPGVTTLAHAIPLDPTNLRGNGWETFRTAALATGAFPFGLAPRALFQPAAEYHTREFFFPRTRLANGQTEFGYFDTLPPAWTVKPDFRYDFLCVDGGAIDNEPVGMARAHLTPQDRTGHATAGGDTPAALLLIDPFPDAAPFAEDYTPPGTLPALAGKVLGALISQARFKPDELTRAARPDVYNQFLLAPKAPPRDGGVDAPLACGGLGGFGGFLSREFRRHDFQLGRRNAQRFLRQHFVLPERLSDGRPNPLFADWSDALKARYRVRRDAQGRVLEDDGQVIDAGGGRVPPAAPIGDFLPVVPLVGERLTREETPPTWMKYSRADLERLRGQVTARAKAVVERLIAGTTGPATKFLLRRAWWLKRDDLIEDYAIARVRDALTARGQLG